MNNDEYLDFVEFVHSKYFAIKYRHESDDWEQEYFDALTVKYDTDKVQVLAEMFYWDDDTTGEIAHGILEMLKGKKLLDFDCFDDEENETTIVVARITKGE